MPASSRVIVRSKYSESEAKIERSNTTGPTKSQNKLYALVVNGDNVEDWVPVAGRLSQACVISGVNMSPSNPSRRVINHKIYDHYELLKQISVKKNYPLKKELADYFAALSAKDILSQSEREELAYLSQIEVHLFK